MKKSTRSHSPSEPRRAMARSLALALSLQQSTVQNSNVALENGSSTQRKMGVEQGRVRSQIAWVSVPFW
jgi:hypothetical protein